MSFTWSQMTLIWSSSSCVVPVCSPSILIGSFDSSSIIVWKRWKCGGPFVCPFPCCRQETEYSLARARRLVMRGASAFSTYVSHIVATNIRSRYACISIPLAVSCWISSGRSQIRANPYGPLRNYPLAWQFFGLLMPCYISWCRWHVVGHILVQFLSSFAPSLCWLGCVLVWVIEQRKTPYLYVCTYSQYASPAGLALGSHLLVWQYIVEALYYLHSNSIHICQLAFLHDGMQK